VCLSIRDGMTCDDDATLGDSMLEASGYWLSLICFPLVTGVLEEP
jgi:hypothetical protein